MARYQPENSCTGLRLEDLQGSWVQVIKGETFIGQVGKVTQISLGRDRPLGVLFHKSAYPSGRQHPVAHGLDEVTPSEAPGWAAELDDYESSEERPVVPLRVSTTKGTHPALVGDS